MAETSKIRAAAKRPRPYQAAPERRRRIIEAAQGVFARTSLQGARTRDLAKAAQTSQATLFEHFESKEALFHAAVVEPLLATMQGMNDRVESYEHAGSMEELSRLGRASAQANVEMMRKIFPLLTAALFSDLAAGRKLYGEQIAPLLAERAVAISGLVKDGLDPELIQIAIFGVYFALVMDEVFRGKRRPVAGVVEQMGELFRSGFLRDPKAAGRKAAVPKAGKRRVAAG
jgi:AcrR family transcriptional regulator